MEMNSPTQQSHSLWQCERWFARGKKKCSFIRAGFYLNDAFQLNSLKLLLPPQNVSISKQGGLGSFHFADRKRKSIEKTCRLFMWCYITTSHRKSQTSVEFYPTVSPFTYGLKGDFLGLEPLEKEHKNIRYLDMHKSANIWKRKIYRSFPLFPVSLFTQVFFFFLTYPICLLVQNKNKL